jgi:hypothetical protein
VGRVAEVVSIHKDILLATVSVQIAVEHNLSFFLELPDQSLDSEVFGMQSLR